MNVGEFAVNSIVTGNALELIEKLPDNSEGILHSEPMYKTWL